MKRIFYLFIFFLAKFTFSQEIVDWDIKYNAQEKLVEIKANIKDGWHLYSQHIENNVGPVATSFTFKSSDDYQLLGQVFEPKPIKKYDENFEATLDFFEKEVVFTQKIETKKNSNLEGTVTYMVCNETMCLPPVDYKFKLEISN
jgi:DsbC/DsbD-like thiol-disulfide interchange protein